MDLDFGGIADTAISVGSDIARLASGDVSALADVPNSIMKVLDTSTSVVRDLTKNDVPISKSQPILQGELKSVNDHAILEEVRKVQPIVTCTQMPSSFANTVTLPPLIEMDRVDRNGLKIHCVRGNNAIANVSYGTPATVFGAALQVRLIASSQSAFGTRFTTISPLYQRWRLLKYSMIYVPTQATSLSGKVILTFLSGDATTTTADENSMAQRQWFTPLAAITGGSLDYVPPDSNHWKYVTTDSAAGRFECFGVAEVFRGSGTIGNEGARAGTVYATWDVEFSGAVESAIAFSSIYGVRFILNGIYQAYSAKFSLKPYMKVLRWILTKSTNLEDQDSIPDQSLISTLQTSLLWSFEKTKDRYELTNPSSDWLARLITPDLETEIATPFGVVREPVEQLLSQLRSRFGEFLLMQGKDPNSVEELLELGRQFVDLYYQYLVRIDDPDIDIDSMVIDKD